MTNNMNNTAVGFNDMNHKIVGVANNIGQSLDMPQVFANRTDFRQGTL